MNYLKNLGKSLLWIIGLIIILTFIMTIFSYFDIFGEKITSVLKIIIPIIALFIGGIKTGKCSKKKGWLEGLKLGLIFIVLIFILSIILSSKIELKNILYYIILIISTVFGSMIGINKNNLENK